MDKPVRKKRRSHAIEEKTAVRAERWRDAERMRAKRAVGRDIDIPPVGNIRRRRLCKGRPALFLRTYFPDIFYNPFSRTQIEMIGAFERCLASVGWKAVAAERGGGKTNISLHLCIYALVYGFRKFAMILGANATEARRNAMDISAKFEDSNRWSEFAVDFPEVCTPVAALAGAPQRANQMSHNGRLLLMKWSSEMFRLPTVEGSDCSGSIILSRGLDSAIRGTQYLGVRPDLVLLDDPETADSAKSQTQTQTLDDRIGQDVAGLAGPNRSITLLYLGTITHRRCLADRYTDPAEKPAWAGRRYPLLEQYPDDMEMWNKYVEQYQRDTADGDGQFTKAHAMYIANREQMDKGALVSSDSRYIDDPGKLRPDGSTLEASTLQFCFNRIASIGQESFNTEYQQIPPQHEEPQTAAITRRDIIKSITGRERGIVPAGATSITAGIDVGARLCHWCVVACAGGVDHIIDYGFEQVHSPLEANLKDPSSAAAVEQAILTALLEIRDVFDNGWAEEATGEIIGLDTCMVDSGYKDAAVYEFCRSGPRNLYRPSKGFGSRSGQAKYRHPARKGSGKKVGQHWFATKQQGEKIWLYNVDADFWKERVQVGFMLPRDGGFRPGATTLFGSDPIAHIRFAEHINAEIRTTVFRDGKEVTYWDIKRSHNHWLDALYLAIAGAVVIGRPIFAASLQGGDKQENQITPTTSAKRAPMSERQAAKRKRRA